MADVKISGLTAATSIDGTEVFPIVQDSTTKKATINLIYDEVDERIDTAISGVEGGSWPQYWVGVSTGCDTISDAVARFSAGGAQAGEGCTLYFKTNQTISSNLTIPANISLSPQNGAIITIDATYTVTYNGHVIDPGPVQWLQDDATAADATKGIKFSRGAVEYVRPEWFGANGDNGTGAGQLAANAAAINACSNCWPIIDTYFGTRGKILFSNGSYNVGNVVLTAKAGPHWLGTWGASNARRGTRILKVGAVDTNLIEVSADGSLYHDICFEGIRFESQAGNTGTSHGIYNNTSTVVYVKDCYFNGFYGQDGDYAIYSNYQTHIDGISTNNCSNGVYIGASDGSIVQSEIAHTGRNTDWSTENPYYAVYAGGECRIVGCKLMGDGGSAKENIVTTGLGVGTSNVIVGDTIIDNNRIGVAFINIGSAVGGSFSNINIYVGSNTYATADGIKFYDSATVYSVNWTGGKIFKTGSTWTAGYGIVIGSLGYSGGNQFNGLHIMLVPDGPISIADASIPVNTGVFSRAFQFRNCHFKSGDHKIERSGNFVTGDSNEAITAGQWVYKAAAGYKIADANGSGTFPAIGKAVTAASATAKTILVHESGYHRDVDGFAYTSGGRLYLSDTAGADTQTAPTTGNFEQVLGYAYNADEIVINPVLATRTVP